MSDVLPGIAAAAAGLAIVAASVFLGALFSGGVVALGVWLLVAVGIIGAPGFTFWQYVACGVVVSIIVNWLKA